MLDTETELLVNIICRMHTNFFIIIFNEKWTSDYKHLDHNTKPMLVNDGISFDDFIKKIFKAIKLNMNKFEATIWFNINLSTSKGV